jgi:hypothetical protein
MSRFLKSAHVAFTAAVYSCLLRSGQRDVKTGGKRYLGKIFAGFIDV